MEEALEDVLEADSDPEVLLNLDEDEINDKDDNDNE